MGNGKKIGVEVGSILVFGLGVFTLVSLAGFHAADPSFFSSGVNIPQNFCGKIGSFLAAALFHVFGLGAFLFPAAFFFVASSLHRREGVVHVMGVLGGMTVAMSSATVFLALQWKSWTFGGAELLTGGAFGTWISEGLAGELNYFGSSLVSLLCFMVSLVISTPVTITDAVAHSLRWLAKTAVRLVWFVVREFFLLLKRLVMRMITELSAFLSRQFHAALDRLAARLTQVREVPADVLHPPIASVPRIEPVPQVADADETPVLIAAEEPSASPPMGLPVSAPRALDQKITIVPREVESSAGAAQKLVRPPVKSQQGHWKLPTIEFLKKPPIVDQQVDRSRLIANSEILTQKFADFGIDGEVTAVRPGPVITLYEFKPGPGVKVSRIAALADDLSMALSAQSVRILAPLPGKSVVGIEIPSDSRETVYLREFLQHPDFYGSKHSIPVVMGKDIGGQTYLSDLARMPHLLCAGQTGSGKSVFMNGLICSLFFRFTPDELRMILVDPKFIEFRAYQDMPHLLLPVVDDPKMASVALKWAVREMERRYRILAKMGARNLASFNQKVEDMGAAVVRDLLFTENPESETPSSASGSDWIEAFEPDESGAPRVGKLPYIVVIIDELADLMMIAKKEVEISIARIAQKARAAGIHLIIATQRPSTDVITGLIKANLPSRVSFQLASFVDSKTILDRAGAERLLGQGDMLFIPPGVSQNLRLHGAYLDDDEIGKITSFLKAQGKPAYRDEILLADDEDDQDGDGESEADDELFQEAIELVRHSGHASASFLQRNLKVGYNRAARMIETMESRGIVGPQDGGRPREVLMR
jgi:S-DNA-T family DNA segregation ATPase FtsK/SpoIIIE